MGRIKIPREFQSVPERSSMMGAYTAGFLAFLSTLYVLHSTSMAAVLMVGCFWILALLLRPLLSEGRWRSALEYFAVLRAYERDTAVENRAESSQAKAPAAEEVDLSDVEKEQFSRLMGTAGFDSNWPKS